MSEIDFLANHQRDDDQEPKDNDSKKEKIIWSEPEDVKPIPKTGAFSLLSFLHKKKVGLKPAASPKPTIDKNKIRESRQEILKLIKRNENREAKPDHKIKKSRLASLLERFKRSPGHKEIIIDYQQEFNREKAKQSLSEPMDPPNRSALGLAKRPGQIKPATNPPAEKKKPVVVKPIVKPRTGWLSKIIKLFKDKMAINRPKQPAAAKPAKVSLGEITKAIKPAATAASLKTAAPETKKIESKDQSPDQPEPARNNAKAAKVLETNLIKGEIITFFDWRQKIISLISAILTPVLLVGLIYLGLGYYQKQGQAKIQDQAKKFTELTKQINQAEAGLNELTEFQARLKIVSQIFAQHIYWTNFFKFLEDNTIKNVYYSGFDGDTSGEYTLNAVALKFSNISAQVDSFKSNPKIIKVKTAGGELIPGGEDKPAGAGFNITFSILKDIFIE